MNVLLLFFSTTDDVSDISLDSPTWRENYEYDYHDMDEPMDIE